MSNKFKTKNDVAWEKLFDKYNIISNINKKGTFEITSHQINKFRQARLMTKFDHKNNLPELFKNNKLSILPISRGSYIIAQFNAYHKLEEASNKAKKVNFPSHIQSIDVENITSEATAINVAYISGIFADFTGDEKLLPTVDGRMSSEAFNFKIKSSINNEFLPICVLNSQVEIDGGYEGASFLTIIEAKNSISDDFLIRQLYYPYRLWQKKLNKPVKPIFLIYSNGIFKLYEYIFEEIENYNSLLLVKQKKYSIEAEEIILDDIIHILKTVKKVQEPEIPFPQANSFERIINLCEILHENSMLSHDEITYRYDFNPRQTDYYTNAAKYLGLIDKKIEEGNIHYNLTDKGKKLFSMSIKVRNLKFVEYILEHEPFFLTFKQYLSLLRMPSKESIVNIMKSSDLYNVNSDSTYFRRASTISSWINWIIELFS